MTARRRRVFALAYDISIPGNIQKDGYSMARVKNHGNT